MKKILKFLFVVWVVVGTFSCTHKRYSQKNSTVNVTNVHTKEPYFLFISDIHLDISLKTTDSTTDTGLILK
jgi:uncharacterized protein YxeA